MGKRALDCQTKFYCFQNLKNFHKAVPTSILKTSFKMDHISFCFRKSHFKDFGKLGFQPNCFATKSFKKVQDFLIVHSMFN